MPLPSSKNELLEKLHSAYEKLDSEFNEIPLSLERKNEVGDGISCCDVLAYQIGWANLLLNWDKTELSGGIPKMPAENFKWNQLGSLAIYFYEGSHKKLLNQLRAEFKLAHSQLTNWIMSLSDMDLFELHQRQWAGEKWALVKWIQVNTIAPYQSARTKVRRFKREHGLL